MKCKCSKCGFLFDEKDMHTIKMREIVNDPVKGMRYIFVSHKFCFDCHKESQKFLRQDTRDFVQDYIHKMEKKNDRK